MYQKINKNLKRDSSNQVMLTQLIEHISDQIRIWPKEVKKKNCKELIEMIFLWSTYTNEEAVGLLEIAKQRFIQLALTEEEKTEKKRFF